MTLWSDFKKRFETTEYNNLSVKYIDKILKKDEKILSIFLLMFAFLGIVLSAICAFLHPFLGLTAVFVFIGFFLIILVVLYCNLRLYRFLRNVFNMEDFEK